MALAHLLQLQQPLLLEVKMGGGRGSQGHVGPIKGSSSLTIAAPWSRQVITASMLQVCAASCPLSLDEATYCVKVSTIYTNSSSPTFEILI